jgi:hypothetical protein
MIRTAVLWGSCLCAALLPTAARAQPARDSRVHVTAVDPSGLVIPGAAVTLVGLEPATQAAAVPPRTTSDDGVAIIERVTPGRYSIRVEFPGFDIGLLRDIRVRAGDSRHVVILPLQKFEDTVTVGRNVQEVAADRRATEFGVNLSQDQIEGLSDDPEELKRQLAELAGPDAIIRLDSFEGQQLPPKAQIKSIHVTRDQFAAEAAYPGSTFVDIITQPGVGPLRGGMNMSLRDGSLTGRSQFTPTRGPEQFRSFGGNLGGTLVPGKTSFSASVNGNNNYLTPILNAVLPDGTRAETLNVRQPFSNVGVNSVVDHALTRDQTLRIGYNGYFNTRRNNGVGNYNLPERGFSTEQREQTLRVQEAGPLGRRTFINSRLSYMKFNLNTRSATEAPTLVVQDAFTAGGAQQHETIRAHVVSLASDIDYVRGIHSWRGGLQFDANQFEATGVFNGLGTYTFSSLDAFRLGTPLLYTQSLQTANVAYHNIQGAGYFQDDIRVRRGLTLSPGVRYSAQTRVSERTAIEPRFGFTWAPRANGATTVRGSLGTFHSFLPLQIIEMTLRQNDQREIVILNPSYPDPPDVTATSIPANAYRIGENFKLGRNLRYSAGIDQVLSPRVRMNVLYNYLHLQQQPNGNNLNAPVNGIRPDPGYANIIESVTEAQIRRHEIHVNAIINLAAPSPALQQARWNWRRVNMNVSYMYIRARNNANGPFDVSPTGNLEDDWGPGPADTPYRVQILATSNQLRNLTANMTYTANAGYPYNWTTGFDDNQDGLLNDRPAGVGLRSLRGAGQQTLNMRVQYAFALSNPQRVPTPQARYRMNVFININNLTNHQNLGGYSGVATSPLFRMPTLAMNLRTVNVGAGDNF